MKRRILQTVILLVLIAGCGAHVSNTPFAIAGYNCEELLKIELEEPLKEISGLAYDKQRNEFLAINDEQGLIFVLDAETFKIKTKIHFASKGDYEELQLSEDCNIIYILKSDGTIFKMQYDGSSINDVIIFDYTGSKTEFESFYIKPASNELVLIPKKSQSQNIDGEVVGYVVNSNTGAPIDQKDFKIDWKKLTIAPGIHPSGVAIQSSKKEIYVLASVERMLIVLDTSYKIIAEYKLPSSIFQQPEGITFDAQRNLYISNEARDTKPTIIKIPIQTK